MVSARHVEYIEQRCQYGIESHVLERGKFREREEDEAEKERGKEEGVRRGRKTVRTGGAGDDEGANGVAEDKDL